MPTPDPSIDPAIASAPPAHEEEAWTPDARARVLMHLVRFPDLTAAEALSLNRMLAPSLWSGAATRDDAARGVPLLPTFFLSGVWRSPAPAALLRHWVETQPEAFDPALHPWNRWAPSSGLSARTLAEVWWPTMPSSWRTAMAPAVLSWAMRDHLSGTPADMTALLRVLAESGLDIRTEMGRHATAIQTHGWWRRYLRAGGRPEDPVPTRIGTTAPIWEVVASNGRLDHALTSELDGLRVAAQAAAPPSSGPAFSPPMLSLKTPPVMGPSACKNRQAFTAWREALAASLGPEEVLAAIDRAWAAPRVARAASSTRASSRAAAQRWMEILTHPSQAPLWADDQARATVPLAWRLLAHACSESTWPIPPTSSSTGRFWTRTEDIEDVLVPAALRHVPQGATGWIPIWVREGAASGHPLRRFTSVAAVVLQPKEGLPQETASAVAALRAWMGDHATALWRGADAPEWVPLWSQIEAEVDAVLRNPVPTPIAPSGFVDRGWPLLAAAALHTAPTRVPVLARPAVAAGAWMALNAPGTFRAWRPPPETTRRALETLAVWGYDPPSAPSPAATRATTHLATLQALRTTLTAASGLHQGWRRDP